MSAPEVHDHLHAGVASAFTASRHFYYLTTDAESRILCCNRHFRDRFGERIQPLPGAALADFILLSEVVSLKQAILSVTRNLDTVRDLEVHLESRSRQFTRIRWEVSAISNQDQMQLQWIGINMNEVYESGSALGTLVGSLPERYKAYELGALGLWRFEYRIPIPVHLPVEEIIALTTENSYLAECNDKLARMYGYAAAEEILGASMAQLMDLQDPSRMTFLRNFIQQGFLLESFETREFDRNGQVKFFLNTMSGIVEGGFLKRVWGTQQDITEQRVAQDQLKFQAALYNTISDAVISSDLSLVVTSWNKRAEEVYGIPAGAIIGKVLDDIVHPQYRGADINEVIRTIEAAGRWEGEVSFTRQTDQTERTVLASITRQVNEQGQTTGYVGINKDITDRKQAEKILQLQASLLDNVTDVIVTTDQDNRITSWNRIAEASSGLKAEETLGCYYRDVVPLDYSPYTREEVNATLHANGLWRGEASFINTRGERKVHLYSMSRLQDPEGNFSGTLAVGKDITERKAAEARLQESELFYRTLITYTRDGVLIIGDDGIIHFTSPSVEQILGYSPDEVRGTNIMTYAHPDDHEMARAALRDELNKTPSSRYIRVRTRKKNGEWCWCILRGHNLLHNNIVNGIMVYFFDDTARKQAEDALRESENRFRKLIQDLSLGVMLQNEKAEVIIYNKAALELLGIDAEQLQGITSYDPRWNVIHENGDPFPGPEHPVPCAIRTRKPVRDVVMGVFRPQRNDRVWLLVNAEPQLEENGSVKKVICTFADITMQKNLAKELTEKEIEKQRLITQATIDGQEKERMEIGKELHDNISQHLTTTRLYVEVMRDRSDEAVKEMLDRIHKNLTDIINEIRHLSQSLVPPTLGDIGLVESMRDICNALKITHRFEVEFVHRYFNEEQLPDNMKLMFFRIFQEQINNIIRHAEAAEIRILLQADAEQAVMFIYDNGKGFDPDQRRKGQGLKNISNRASLFKGRVDIKTSPGKGCALTVLVPLEHED